MHTVLHFIKRTVTYSTLLVALVAAPLLPSTSTVFAEEEPCVAPADDQPGIHRPTGSDAKTFVYQCEGSHAGMWVNSYFSYNPVTQSKTPLFDRNYQYNCTSGNWTMTDWNYSPARAIFVEIRVAANPSPNLPTNCPPPATSNTPDGHSGTNGSNPGISNTGPNSTNTTNNTGTVNSSSTNNNNASMSNGISSQAGTGDTFVLGNTNGGNATSGDAQSIANIANLLQTSSNAFGPGTSVFTANINGDVNGDFIFDPDASLGNTGPGSTNTTNNGLNVNTQNTNNTNAQIVNDIDVGATSGNATVGNNTTGGNATSGDAQAIVNLMNLINSTVSSGQSFIGTVNINGNLNGDILLPQNLIDQLIASNTGPGSSNSLSNAYNANASVENNVNSNIANNITSTAATGDASVSGNTNAGTATSGNGNTNVTLLNLTGSNTIGKNNILVFVNVLGTWVGMIMNAPAGTTAASLGGGITGTGPDSTNNVNNTANLNSSLLNNSNFGITNNVNAHAASGDATVSGNTTGGNATSGDASTAVNILNMSGSNINLSDWFGILFINVFGNWCGSFGVNTANNCGAETQQPAVPTGRGGEEAAPAAPSPEQPAFVSFAPALLSGNASNKSSEKSEAATLASVLGTQTMRQPAKTYPSIDNKAKVDYTFAIIGTTIAVLMLAGERIVTLRKAHKA